KPPRLSDGTLSISKATRELSTAAYSEITTPALSVTVAGGTPSPVSPVQPAMMAEAAITAASVLEKLAPCCHARAISKLLLCRSVRTVEPPLYHADVSRGIRAGPSYSAIVRLRLPALLQCRMSGSQPGDRDTVRRTRYIVQADTVAE